MNRKQKIIVSITGIFIVLLALVGLTYAYFLTRITGNENEKSISVTTANLELVYAEEDDEYVIGENEIIEPGKTFDTKTFTVTNNGNSAIDSYAVILEDVSITYVNDTDEVSAGQITTLGSTIEGKENDFTLTIACKNQDNEDCTGYNAELLEKSGILLTNSIEVEETHTYTVTLTYNETNDDQSADMNKRYNGKFNIIDTSNTVDITGIVTNYEVGDYVQTNSTKRVSVIYADNTYKIVGLETGTHEIKVCASNITNCTKDNAKMTETINIVQGETASGNNSTKTITITELSRVASVNVDGTNGVTINNEIKEYNPFSEETLAAEIYKNVKMGANGTTFGTPINGVTGTTITSLTTDNRKIRKNLISSLIEYTDCHSEDGDVYSNSGYNSCNSGYKPEYMLRSSERIIIHSTVDEMVYTKTNGFFSSDDNNSDMVIGPLTVIKGEKILSTAQDDFGTSYYYRGNVQDNYVNFGDKCWRIVRIQGDGTVKLILEDETACNSETFTGNWLTHYVEAIDLQNTLESWLKTSGIDQNKIKNEKWCVGIISELDPKNPSFKCSGTHEENGEIVKSKIGGITMDEVVYASGDTVFTYLINEKFASNNPYSFYTISPAAMKAGVQNYDVNNGVWDNNYGLLTYSSTNTYDYSGKAFYRPAIVINNDVLVDAATSGNGTRTNPYVIN